MQLELMAQPRDEPNQILYQMIDEMSEWRERDRETSFFM